MADQSESEERVHARPQAGAQEAERRIAGRLIGWFCAYCDPMARRHVVPHFLVPTLFGSGEFQPPAGERTIDVPSLPARGPRGNGRLPG